MHQPLPGGRRRHIHLQSNSFAGAELPAKTAPRPPGPRAPQAGGREGRLRGPGGGPIPTPAIVPDSPSGPRGAAPCAPGTRPRGGALTHPDRCRGPHRTRRGRGGGPGPTPAPGPGSPGPRLRPQPAQVLTARGAAAARSAPPRPVAAIRDPAPLSRPRRRSAPLPRLAQRPSLRRSGAAQAPPTN